MAEQSGIQRKVMEGGLVQVTLDRQVQKEEATVKVAREGTCLRYACIKCYNDILGQFALTPEHECFCEKCYCCAKCNKSLIPSEQLAFRVGKYNQYRYCEICYDKVQNEHCTKCAAPLCAQYVETSDGQNLCTGCHACARCGKELWANKHHREQDNYRYCVPCFVDHIEMPASGSSSSQKRRGSGSRKKR